MRYLIVYAHPNPQSFNHAIREKIEGTLQAANCEYAVRDLYEMHFDPALKAAEIAMGWDGPVPDDIKQEQDHIRASDVLIFIYPIWWSDMPAMLKGYIDRVFSYGFAWTMEQDTFSGLLKGKKAVIVNTLASHRDEFISMGLLECMNKTIDAGIFDFSGIQVIEHKYLCGVLEATAEERVRMLGEVGGMMERIMTGRQYPDGSTYSLWVTRNNSQNT
jgi:NAD(P)H dehydrogenase (quinone)